MATRAVLCTRVIVALGVLFVLGAGPVPAQVCVDYGQYVHPVGTVSDCDDSYAGGSYSSICEAGDWIAVSNGRSVVFVNTTDAANPEIVKRFDFVSSQEGYEDEIFSMRSAGDYLYLLSHMSFRIVRFQGVDTPTEVGSLPLDNSYGGAIDLWGNFALAARGSDGILIIDISDPTAPSLLGASTEAGAVYSLEIVGNICYTASTNGVFRLFDLTTLPVPALLDSVALSGSYPGPFDIDGDFAAVLVGNDTVDLLNIATPTDIALVGSIPSDENSTDLAIDGDFAVVCNWSGMQMYGLSELGIPEYLGEVPANIYGGRVLLSNGLAYLGDNSPSLTIYDLSSRALPPVVGWSATSGTEMAIVGDILYAGNGKQLSVTDISSPDSPATVRLLDAAGTIRDLVVDGSRLYVADSYYGLQIFDVTSPATPQLLGTGYAPDSPESIAVAGDWLYMACEEAGVVVFNIADPRDPYIVNWTAVPYEANGIAISGSYIYVADTYVGLLVLDVTDPTDPNLVGITGVPGTTNEVAVKGNHAFVGGWDGGFWSIDISDPTRPSIAGHSSLPANVESIAFAGNYAFVAGGWDGTTVVDISDPVDPRAVGVLRNVGMTQDVVVAGGFVYALSGGNYNEAGGLLVSAIQCGWDGTAVSPSLVPVAASLGQNYPNPFNPRTTIYYELGSELPVSLRIYDLAGRLVRTLVTGEMKAAGPHEANWEGRDQTGRQAAAGVYLYELVTPEVRETRRMTLLK